MNMTMNSCCYGGTTTDCVQINYHYDGLIIVRTTKGLNYPWPLSNYNNEVIV